MKKRRNKLIGITIIWMLAVVLYILTGHNKNTMTRTEFTDAVDITMKEDKVGAKVTLKEAIHGKSGVTYRYKIEVDCDKWEFETMYTTTTPLNWVIDDTSAAEVVLYDEQIEYEDTVYAAGTYYTIPLLNDLSSEEMDFEEWQENLMKKAYQMYESMPHRTLFHSVLTWLVYLIPLITIFYLVLVESLNALDEKKVEPVEPEDLEENSEEDSKVLDEKKSDE